MRYLAPTFVALLFLGLWAGMAAADAGQAQRLFDRGELPRARELFRVAAEAGDAHAQFMYGRLLLQVPDRRGVAWIRKSADAGHLPGEFRMAWFFMNDLYVGQDKLTSFGWFKKAASHGSADEATYPVESANAHYWLGRAYDEGFGTRKDPVRSLSELRRAAALGHTVAQFLVAEKLEKGDGVERDLVEAHKLFVLSWKQEFPYARKHVMAIRKQLSPAQFETSRKRIRAWLSDQKAGTRGAAYDDVKRRTRGEKALIALEERELSIRGSLSQVLREVHAPCESVWLKSRRTLSSRARGSRRWSERWTFVVCREVVSHVVHYTAVGNDVRWDIKVADRSP